MKQNWVRPVLGEKVFVCLHFGEEIMITLVLQNICTNLLRKPVSVQNCVCFSNLMVCKNHHVEWKNLSVFKPLLILCFGRWML